MLSIDESRRRVAASRTALDRSTATRETWKWRITAPSSGHFPWTSPPCFRTRTSGSRSEGGATCDPMNAMQPSLLSHGLSLLFKPSMANRELKVALQGYMTQIRPRFSVRRLRTKSSRGEQMPPPRITCGDRIEDRLARLVCRQDERNEPDRRRPSLAESRCPRLCPQCLLWLTTPRADAPCAEPEEFRRRDADQERRNMPRETRRPIPFARSSSLRSVLVRRVRLSRPIVD